MSDDDLNLAIVNVIDTRIAAARTVVPGKVTALDREAESERDATFESGVGRRQGGEETADGLTPSVPVLALGGGGFNLHIPLAAGDETLGLVSDRPLGAWRQDRTPGKSPAFGARHHNLSDTLLIPFAITAPAGAPTDADPDLVISGPDGDAVRIAKADNAVTITKQGEPDTLATITLAASGSIEIAVADGQAVVIGGDAALSDFLVKVTALETALGAMLDAGGATPPSPMLGTNGALAFQAAKAAFDLAVAAMPLGTDKLKAT